jgi:hypothetical protein
MFPIQKQEEQPQVPTKQTMSKAKIQSKED